jgi:hypothetical protein
MAYILLKKFYKAKWGPNERKLSLHVIDDDLATEIAQELNKALEAMKNKVKVVPVFHVNKRGQFVAKMNHDFNKYFSEDFFARCFTVLLKFGFKLDKQYDEPPYGGAFKEVYVFLRI